VRTLGLHIGKALTLPRGPVRRLSSGIGYRHNGGHSDVSGGDRDDGGGDRRPLRLLVKPTASGRKWRATIDGMVVCVSAWPFVQSARILLEKGYPANVVIEMWRTDATEWALRGRLGAVAATVIEGEKAASRAKKASPVGARSDGYSRHSPGKRAALARLWRPPLRLIRRGTLSRIEKQRPDGRRPIKPRHLQVNIASPPYHRADSLGT
jgi:hypothetical protein